MTATPPPPPPPGGPGSPPPAPPASVEPATAADEAGRIAPDSTATEGQPTGGRARRAARRARRRERRRTPLGARRRAAIGVGICALLMLAAAGGGAFGGWTLANRTAVAGRANAQAAVVEVPAYVGTDAASMPDVRGLAVDDAMTVLSDAGIPANVVASTKRPSAGAEGTVVAQTPAYGTETPAKVGLVVSAGATMPTLVGSTAQEADAALNELGARIERKGGYDPDEAVGTVLATSPKAGADLEDAVVLTVNSPPSARYLSVVQANDGGCSTDDALVIDGRTFKQGLRCSSGSEEYPQESSWLLEKAVDRVTGVVGVPDTADPGTSVHVRLRADGKVLLDGTVRYGSPEKLDARTSGALRLTLEVWAADGSSAELGLGDVQLAGSAAAMLRLPQR